jgi:hypothetical protein
MLLIKSARIGISVGGGGLSEGTLPVTLPLERGVLVRELWRKNCGAVNFYFLLVHRLLTCPLFWHY